jgi:hypothetical protein
MIDIQNFILCFGWEYFASDAQVEKLIVIYFGSFEGLIYKAREILSEKCCVQRVGNDVVPDNLGSYREKLHTSRIPTSPSFFCVALGS